jgi:hypothetical protein
VHFVFRTSATHFSKKCVNNLKSWEAEKTVATAALKLDVQEQSALTAFYLGELGLPAQRYTVTDATYYERTPLSLRAEAVGKWVVDISPKPIRAFSWIEFAYPKLSLS